MVTRAPLVPGDVIAKRYRIQELLGQGGMALVYRAQNINTERECALKLVHTHLVDRPELVQLFLREAKVGATLGKSPYIVEVLDADTDPERAGPFMVMELLEGQPLDDYLQAHGALDPALARTLLEQLSEALDQAHRAGVVHRDLKPGNLFLTHDHKGRPLLKVMDFGIAKVLEMQTQHTATQVGTPAYCAPEQMGSFLREIAARQGITIATGISPATDVWPLGLIAYELLTGWPPGQYWDAQTSSELPTKVVFEPQIAPSQRAKERAERLPKGFDDWFAKCLAKNASERFGSGKEALDALLGLFPSALQTAALSEPEQKDIIHRLAPSPAKTEVQSPAGTVAQAPALAQKTELASQLPPMSAGSSWAGDKVVSKPEGKKPELPRTSRINIKLLLAALAGLMVVGFGVCSYRYQELSDAQKLCEEGSGFSDSQREACQMACERDSAKHCTLWGNGLMQNALPGKAGQAASLAIATGAYETGCSLGDPKACVALGQILNQPGVLNNPGRAKELFDKACHAGDSQACALLK